MAPDDKMGMSIEDVVFWTRRCVERTQSALDLPDSDVKDTFLLKETEIAKTYAVVIRVRAKELVELALRMGYKTEINYVRENPFATCVVLGK